MAPPWASRPHCRRAGAGGVCRPGPGHGVAPPGRQPVVRRWRALPRPGAWMDTFRRPWPSPCLPPWCGWCGCWASKAASMGGLLLILLVGLACWPGRWPGPHGAVQGAFTVAAWLCCWAFGPTSRMASGGSPSQRHGHRRKGWQPWAPGAAETWWPAVARCLWDFTAAWCVTCQYNKKPPANSEVLADLHVKNVALLRRLDPPRPRHHRRPGPAGPQRVPVAGSPPRQAPVVLGPVLSVDEVQHHRAVGGS